MTLRLANISKKFGATVALADVSFEVQAGEVHALLGENGAGKSTLMHIANGMLRADSGTISVRGSTGVEVTTPAFASPRAARLAGLGMVHQHFSSIPAFTVAENIALAGGWREIGRAAERRADQLAQQLGLALPVAHHVEDLSVQLRQRLEIVKALAADARVLLLDEPTAALAPREVDELLNFVRGFAAGGGAVALITHKLDEVFRVGDRVTVLRRGEVTFSGNLRDQSPRSLSRAMIGADAPAPARTSARRGDIAIRAHNARICEGRRPGLAAPPVTFEIRSGELVGVAAIEGNGQRQLLRAIAGVDAAGIAAGTLDVASPVAFIPEDRTTEGLIGSFTLAENLLLGASTRMRRWINWSALRVRTAELMRACDVRAGSPDVPAATLSGGNQQKFVLGRALERQPRVVVAEDPTRGLDVLATQAVHERLRAAARNGAAVVVHSSDLDEVLTLADRLFVVARGEVRELPIGSSRAAIGNAMLALEPTE